MVRFLISIPSDLRDSLKAGCNARGQSLSGLYSQLCGSGKQHTAILPHLKAERRRTTWIKHKLSAYRNSRNPLKGSPTPNGSGLRLELMLL